MKNEDRGLVAITGANGTIGNEAVHMLKRGPSLQEFIGRTEFHVVPDNSVLGSYDHALAGVRYVIHVAGVWPTPDKHPDNDIYLPFVNSMHNILSAAEKSGTIKRIVFTQAGAAMVHPDDGNTYGTAMDIPLSESTAVHPGLLSLAPPLSSPHHAYCAAKAQCMTTLQTIRGSMKYSFSIAQVIPGTVMGTSELVSTKLEAKRAMDRMSRALLFNEPKPRYLFGFVDVKDCAKVHVEALDEVKIQDSELPDWFIAASPGDRFNSGSEIWKEAGDVVDKNFQDEVHSGIFTIGRDNAPINMPYYVENRLTESKLLSGGKFKTLNECIQEVARWYAVLEP